MGTTKPKMEDLTPVMIRVERKLSGTSTWLSYSGRLQMINSAISPIVTYVMCTVRLPRGVIENIDRIRKQCLWRGNIDKKKGGNLVAWEIVQQPKNKGGLGVINLRLQNDALLLKHLHRFYNKMEIPWIQLIWFKYYQNKIPHASREVGSFWWKDILRLHSPYRGITKCAIGDGATCCFRTDPWSVSILESKFLRIASFAKDKLIFVRGVLQAEEFDELFFLPLSVQAAGEL
jgi:hypothetical protein